MEGFSLDINDQMRGKFFEDSSYTSRTDPQIKFPFLDIWFYEEDSEYIWGITLYERWYLLYPLTSVFPLGRAPLDGKLYSVPRKAEELVRADFGLTMCKSNRGHRLKEIDEIHTIPCRDLKALFDVFDSLDVSVY